jgi:hypothetical protein
MFLAVLPHARLGSGGDQVRVTASFLDPKPSLPEVLPNIGESGGFVNRRLLSARCAALFDQGVRLSFKMWLEMTMRWISEVPS